MSEFDAVTNNLNAEGSFAGAGGSLYEGRIRVSNATEEDFIESPNTSTNDIAIHEKPPTLKRFSCEICEL